MNAKQLFFTPSVCVAMQLLLHSVVLFMQALFANIEVTFRSRLKEQLLKLNITNNGSTKHGYVCVLMWQNERDHGHCCQTLAAQDDRCFKVKGVYIVRLSLTR